MCQCADQIGNLFTIVQKNYFSSPVVGAMLGGVPGVKRGLALGEGKYLKKPLSNTSTRVAGMLMNLRQMMFIPLTT